MTQRHMRIFVEVYKCLNMTHAAGNLNMTQPAVTKAIKEIESFYGIRLFERYNKGIYPTEKAKELYYQALSILSAYSKMEKELKEADNTGVLRLGSTISLGIHMMPLLVKRLKESHPGLEIRVNIENGASLERKLLSNYLDVAYIEGPVSDKDLWRKGIIKDQLAVIAAPDSDVRASMTLAELAAMPILFRQKGSVTRSYVESIFTSHDLVINMVWESESSHAIINAVHENIGLAILPERLVTHYVDTGWVRRIGIKDADLGRTDHIAIHKDKYRSDLIKELLEMDYQGEYSRTQYEN